MSVLLQGLFEAVVEVGFYVRAFFAASAVWKILHQMAGK